MIDEHGQCSTVNSFTRVFSVRWKLKNTRYDCGNNSVPAHRHRHIAKNSRSNARQNDTRPLESNAFVSSTKTSTCRSHRGVALSFYYRIRMTVYLRAGSQRLSTQHRLGRKRFESSGRSNLYSWRFETRRAKTAYLHFSDFREKDAET